MAWLNSVEENRNPGKERVAEEEARKGLPGMMIDFGAKRKSGNTWDFNNPFVAFEGLQQIEEKRALLMLASPNDGLEEGWEKKSEDEAWGMMKRQVEFTAMLMRMQREQGLYFLSEHPAEAKSWDLECIKNLARYSDVQTIVVGGIRWMTNSVEAAKTVEKMGDAGENWMDRRIAEGYGEKFNDELFQALVKQMKRDGR